MTCAVAVGVQGKSPRLCRPVAAVVLMVGVWAGILPALVLWAAGAMGSPNSIVAGAISQAGCKLAWWATETAVAVGVGAWIWSVSG